MTKMTSLTKVVIFAALSLCFKTYATSSAATAPAEQLVPVPSFDSIDYSEPNTYLAIPASLGNQGRIRTLATAFEGTREEKLIAIHRWIAKNIRFDPNVAYKWRNFDLILAQGSYGGCADHSIVFGALSRASGIPTVWVKTMDIDWIHEFRASNGRCKNWRGHVFLEVFVNNKWMLLDATDLVLYEDYNTTERILPGNRYAYDKGADPYLIVLSCRWELWKQQTRAYFINFDLSKLPLVHRQGRPLLDRGSVFIAADSPVYKSLTERCRELGYSVRKSFNTGFDEFIPRSRGNYLIIACVGDKLVLPARYHQQLLPVSLSELKSRMAQTAYGTLHRKLNDGTKVFVVFGKDLASIEKAVNKLTLN